MSLRMTSQVQCLPSQIKPTAVRKWNDEIDRWFMNTHIGSMQSKAPKLKDVVIAGPCSELPFWYGHGGGGR